MNTQFDWYDKDTYCCKWPKRNQARIRLIDTGTGMMNRKLQRLIHRMYDRLKEAGLLDSSINLESINRELSSEDDFYFLTFGSQVKKYLSFVDDFEKDGPSLSTIVRDRNYFIHKYHLDQPEEPVVDNADLDRLKKLIMTIEKASNRFDGKIKQVRSESKKRTNVEKEVRNRAVRVIYREINARNGSASLIQISTALTRDIDGFNSKEVFGMKLNRFVSSNYRVSGKGNKMIVRSGTPSLSRNASEDQIYRRLLAIVSECRGMKNPSAEIGQRLKKIPGLKYSQYGGKNQLKSFLDYFNISIRC